MTPATSVDLGWALAGVVLVASGAVLCRRRPTAPAGGLLGVAGALLALTPFVPADVVAPRVGVAAAALVTAATAAFPRPPRDRAGRLTVVVCLLGTPVLVMLLEPPGGLRTGDVARVVTALACLGLANLWWRLESTPSGRRGPLLWMLSAVGVVLFLVGVSALGGMPAGVAATVHAGVGLVGVAAVLGARPRQVLDGRWLASRVAAWSFALGCAFAAATLVLTVLGSRSGAPPGAVTLAVTAVVCGTAWNPLLRLVQRVCDGALFGWRPDALTAAQRMAVGIGDDPAAAVRAIQEGLVLPWCALVLTGEEPIEVGVVTDRRRVIPLDHGDEHVGDLVIGIRAGDLGLSADDERVLGLCVPMLVQAVRLRRQAEHLQQARQAGASTREEERRRLRRDLHDGLGPRLTGIAFTADAARLAAGDGTTGPLLDRIREQAETAIHEIRELVYGLRPPALDELGLVAAVEASAAGLNGLRVDVDAERLPPLGAAVEVAAYRIAVEALTNVARHGRGTSARVRLEQVGGALVVTVTGDGSAAGPWVPGVGMTSMRERAAELGGTVAFRGSATGSAVTARLPLDVGRVDAAGGAGRRPGRHDRGAGASSAAYRAR